MRVAFDEQIFAIQRFGGISRVFAELAHQFVSNPGLGVELQPVAAPLVNEYITKDPLTMMALDVRQSRHWAPSIARSLARRRHKGPADIVHNTFYLPRALKDYPQAKRVVTVHDMIPEVFPNSRRRLDLATIKRRYVERADAIVCVSEFTRNDLIRIYGSPEAPIYVIPSGVGPEFRPDVPRIAGWPDQYILHVGNRADYKGGEMLFQAFAMLADEHPKVFLILAGGGSLSHKEVSLLRCLSLEGRVIQQQIPDGLMACAYANAKVFVFPSQYEGFGLPVLEAMASGVPTLLSDASALPEVGGRAALYFDPMDTRDLAAKLSLLLSDEGLRCSLRQAGMKRSAVFTWENAAQSYAHVYRATAQLD